jgi:hypothetical protein
MASAGTVTMPAHGRCLPFLLVCALPLLIVPHLSLPLSLPLHLCFLPFPLSRLVLWTAGGVGGTQRERKREREGEGRGRPELGMRNG